MSDTHQPIPVSQPEQPSGNPGLSLSPAAEELYRKLQPLDPHRYTQKRCQSLALMLEEIRVLKRSRNAVLLAHNYQHPEIFEVADFIGDSLRLSQEAARVECEVIVFAGVHFMAETAKLLNPGRTVLLPNLAAGCSLSDTADADDVEDRIHELKAVYPDLAVVCYVNTTAAVKALADACCTSSNAVRIVEALPSENILFVPDENLARYVQSKTRKNIIPWNGNCYVHHQITPENILAARQSAPAARVVVHPECRADVIALADAVLSTEGMVQYAKQEDAREFIIVTECGLSDRLQLEVPGKKFYKSCQLCRYMKANSLEDVLRSLQNLQHPIDLPESTAAGAASSLRRMLELSA